MAGSHISYLWKSPGAAEGFASGVSLHSHTSQSKETLDFLANLGNKSRLMRKLLQFCERRARERYDFKVDYAAGYWTPPLTPKQAFDLESGQIEKLGVAPLVSISDHDTITAPMLLRTVASARHIPVSVEWSAPYSYSECGPGGVCEQSFHLGIHNLPSDTGAEWMRIFEEYTANPSNARLTEILAALHALPNVLIIFNHPLWDLYLIGEERHRLYVEAFMRQNGEFIHALELNGLRIWEENRAVKRMAAQYGKLLISGGDRHGVEPNANINLSNATSFTEFVHEVRYEGVSNVLFMPQYAEPWKHRILQSTLDAIRDYPEFPQGSRRWDERVYHPDQQGVVRPISELWASGEAPSYLTFLIKAVRLMGSGPISGSLRRAWDESRELGFALGD
jgi:hypothetical protein